MFKWNKKQQAELSDNESTTRGIYGLEVCYADDPAVADLVFVHGLTGNRRNTWTDKSSNVFWPKDLLASDALPPMRILSYGYDADIAHFWALASQNRIGEHAGNLVNALTQLRERTDTEGRPIIFVTHSLGGLVTEDALLYSKNSAEPHLQDIVHSASGICFLGTPHCGSDLARWGSIAGSLFNAVKTANVDLVNVLTPNSEVLARVQREFHGMVRTLSKGNDSALEITCFFEELPVRGAGEIVPKHSAILPSYNAIGIHANHMDMTKFSSVQDPGYLAVSGELRRWLKNIWRRRNTTRTDGSIYSYPHIRNHPDDPNPSVRHSAQALHNMEPYLASRGSPQSPLSNAQTTYGRNACAPHYSQWRTPAAPQYFVAAERIVAAEMEDDETEGREAERGYRGIYQGGNSFGETSNASGGKTLQGNFNIGGNMNF